MGREEKREGGAGREVREGGRLREGKEQQVDSSVINIISCGRFTMIGNGPHAAEFPVILKWPHDT